MLMSFIVQSLWFIIQMIYLMKLQNIVTSQNNSQLPRLQYEADALI